MCRTPFFPTLPKPPPLDRLITNVYTKICTSAFNATPSSPTISSLTVAITKVCHLATNFGNRKIKYTLFDMIYRFPWVEMKTVIFYWSHNNFEMKVRHLWIASEINEPLTYIYVLCARYLSKRLTFRLNQPTVLLMYKEKRSTITNCRRYFK